MLERKILIIVLSLVGLLSISAVWGQFPDPGQIPTPGFAPYFDTLTILKRALEDAGAPPLTVAQEQQLRALIAAFQASQLSFVQAQAQQATLRRHLEEAILAGDSAAANAQAASIAKLIGDTTLAQLQAEANFKIQVLAVLKTNDDQMPLLLKRIGTAGLPRLLDSLARPFTIFPGFPGTPVPLLDQIPSFNHDQ